MNWGTFLFRTFLAVIIGGAALCWIFALCFGFVAGR
jgi:hypothetical protein